MTTEAPRLEAPRLEAPRLESPRLESQAINTSRARRIVIFAKAPLPGYAKTRLIPALGLDGSAQLARRLLMHTIEQALAANIGPVELCVSPSVHHPIWETLPWETLPRKTPARKTDPLAWSYQGEGDLGQRMGRAVQRVTAQGESVILIGTDCPGLNADTLRAAAHALDHHHASLTPVSDGGYSLLGLNQYTPRLFTDIPWSTEIVAQLTRQRIAELGWTLQEGPMLHDIDEPDDLQHLPSHWLQNMA